MCMEPMCLASATSFAYIAKEAEAKEPSPHCSLAIMGRLPKGGRVVPRHLCDLLWKGGVTGSKSPLLKTEERRPLQLTKKT